MSSSLISLVSINKSKQDGFYSLEVTKNSEVELESVNAIIMYYDKSDKIIGFTSGYTRKVAKGSTALIKLAIPTNQKTRKNISYSAINIFACFSPISSSDAN